MSAKLASQIENLSQLRLAAIKPGDVFLGEYRIMVGKHQPIIKEE